MSQWRSLALEKSLSGVFPPGFWREHKLPGVLVLLLGLSSALTCCRNNLFVSSVPQLRRKTQGRPNVHVQVSRTPVGAPSCPADDVGWNTPFHCGSVAPQHPFPSQNYCATAVGSAGTASELCNLQVCSQTISSSGVLFSCFRV